MTESLVWGSALRRCVVLGCVLLTSCSLWPWGRQTEQRVGPPADATVYKCEGERQLVVRYLSSVSSVSNGKAAMIVLPEREFRLDQVAAAGGTRYSNGRTTLVGEGESVRLEEGASVLYANCAVSRAK